MDISDDIIKIAAEAGAQAAMERYEHERRRTKKQQYDRRLHNTKLLLRNYRLFHKHVDESIVEESQLNEDKTNALDILYGFEEQEDELYVESIKRSQTRTKIIMQHIDHMLHIYKVYCNQSNNKEEMRRYRVIEAMYITEPVRKVDEIACCENINPRTVYKDIDAACVTLSALLFGIDGIKIRAKSGQ